MNSDRPIESAKADKLHRAAFAASLAQDIAAIPAGPGQVLALVGPWGAGKTSVLKMVCERLDELGGSPVVVEVNPWLFSGTEQLVELFISELADKLSSRTDKRAATVSKRLQDYADVLNDLSWVPIASRLGLVARLLARLLQLRTRMHTGSIEGRRAAIGKALSEANERLLVLVDDIDRLTDSEIRDVVRTVRLVGDFENVVYLLAFDRARVEKALGDKDDPVSGRDYLEKIVQTIHPLPAIRYDDLSAAFAEGIVNAIGEMETGPFDVYDWQNIGSLAVRPLFHSLRDVYRFTNVLPATVRAIGDEVALQDVFALEAVRVLEPDVWDAIVDAAPALGFTRDFAYGGGGREAEYAALKPLVEQVLQVAGPSVGPIRQLLERVFPASQTFLGNMNYGSDSLAQWRRERRVAHPAVFAIYLQRTLEPGAVPAALMDAVYESLETGERTEELLAATTSDQLEELLGRLEAWQHDFPPPNGRAIGALLRQMGRLRTGRRKMLDMGADLALDRIVLRMLRRSEDPAERLAALERALDADLSLTAKASLLLLVGNEENAGHKLIPETDSKRLDKRLAKEIASTPPDRLRDERDVRRLIHWAGKKGGRAAQTRIKELLKEDGLLAKLLQNCLGETISQGMGDVGERRTATLAWDWLQALLPNGELEQRVTGLRGRLDPATVDERMAVALDLAERYAGGWRPNERDW